MFTPSPLAAIRIPVLPEAIAIALACATKLLGARLGRIES